MEYILATLQAAAVIAAAVSAFYWYCSATARVPYVDHGGFIIFDDDKRGKYDVLETSKLQVKLNVPAALWATAAAGLQGLVVIAQIINSN